MEKPMLKRGRVWNSKVQSMFISSFYVNGVKFEKKNLNQIH